jgi:hypothetical protein
MAIDSRDEAAPARIEGDPGAWRTESPTVSGQTEQLTVGVTRIGGRRHAGRVLALAALAALLASALQAVALPVPGASAVTVGSGSYADSTPAGGAVPQDCAGGVMDPRSRTTANFPAGAVPTNDWWTSLLWNKINCTDESANLMAHPLAFHSFTNGLGVSYPTNASVSGTSTGVSEYHYNYAEDLRIGIAGLSVGFDAKAPVRDVADVLLDARDLSMLLPLLGLR